MNVCGAGDQGRLRQVFLQDREQLTCTLWKRDARSDAFAGGDLGWWRSWLVETAVPTADEEHLHWRVGSAERWEC